MTTLKRLIQGQDIAFDTHQAGDGQGVKWRELHLEKRMHEGSGKARFPFFDHAKASSSSRMSADALQEVTKEVGRVLQKNPELTKKLGKIVVESLQRFSDGTATIEDGKAAAKQLAGYFDLDENFLRVVEDYSEGRLVSLKTVHIEPHDRTLHEIYQSQTTLEIRKARRNYPLNIIHPDRH
ncbi:MAG: hypothetical protein HXX12_14040 [Geothrix sp.]|uniref:hypothetical protein n=1 Tax=Geothrix sp. TaxID=1962974 RepID=UPI0018368A4C|nr:hypothetical protein [Geothrix sp.]NWJ42079.1 hypothetical protein [Geothrix sp.]WIL19953.1 MAG: hypothetical protein QOZ81_002492 [Geothrix sp.]